MNSRSMIFASLLAASALSVAAPARAGLVITSRNTRGDLESPAEIRIEGGRLRMDIERPATHSVIFLPAASGSSGESQVVEIDHEKKTYVEMKGAPHYLEGHRRPAMDAVIDWLRARFPL